MSRGTIAQAPSTVLWRALVCLALGIVGADTARAHIVGDPVELALIGAAAPFGDTGVVTYTALGATPTLALLATDSAGLAIVSLSTLAHLGTYSSPDSSGFASVIAAHDATHAFLASNADDGVHVITVTNPAQPTLLTKIIPAAGAFPSPTFLALDCDTLYMTSADSPLIRVFDVADPANPVFLRTVTTPETRGIRSLSVSNGTLVVPGRDGPTLDDNIGAVFLYDVTAIHAADPTLIATIPTLDETCSAAVTPQGTRLLATQRALGGATTLYDITDPQAPAILSTVTAADYAINAYSPLHAVIIKQIAFVAWTQSGLQVMDLDQIDAQSLVQPVGFYDTSSESPFNGFTGAMICTPASNPNTILVADSRTGLFALNATPVYPTLPCLADIDADNDVDVFDFAILAANFAACQVTPFTRGDIDGDTDVDVFDFAILAANFACQP